MLTRTRPLLIAIVTASALLISAPALADAPAKSPAAEKKATATKALPSPTAAAVRVVEPRVTRPALHWVSDANQPGPRMRLRPENRWFPHIGLYGMVRPPVQLDEFLAVPALVLAAQWIF
jgi:hypothetical protein